MRLNTTNRVQIRACVGALALFASTACGCGRSATDAEQGGPGQSSDSRGASQLAATHAAATSTAPAPNDLVAAIEKASDPSAAVDAYAKARAAEPDNPRLTEAYVRRMVALGTPQLAEKQAEDVVARNPQDGVAWAVLAFCSGAANDTTAALNELASAVLYAPDDAFVQHTAGQLLGWYDVLGKASELPAGLPEALEKIRQDLSVRRPFMNAYAAARNFYQQERAAEAKNAENAGSGALDSTADESGAALHAGGAAPEQHAPSTGAASRSETETILPESDVAAAPTTPRVQPPESSTAYGTPIPPVSTAAPYGSGPATNSDMVEDTDSNVGMDDAYTATVEPTYIEPTYEEPTYAEAEAYPVYVPVYYPTYYEVPRYYTYPAWSLGVSVGWGSPWWGGWGWDNCGYYPGWRGWGCGWRTGWWGSCGVVPYRHAYVRCDRAVHGQLRYGMRAGYRDYANRELVGVAHHGNGAHLAAGHFRQGGPNRGEVGFGARGRGGFADTRRSGRGGSPGLGRPGGEGTGRSEAGGMPGGLRNAGRGGEGVGARRGGSSVATGNRAGWGRTTSPQSLYRPRAGATRSGGIGRTDPSHSITRRPSDSLADRSAGSISSRGTSAAPRPGVTRRSVDPIGTRGSATGPSNANRTWPLARGGQSARPAWGVTGARSRGDAPPVRSGATGYRSAGRPGSIGTQYSTPARTSATRGGVTRSVPSISAPRTGRSPGYSAIRPATNSGSSRSGSAIGVPRTVSGSRSMQGSGSYRVGGTSRGAGISRSRGFSSGAPRAFSGGGRSFSGSATRSGGRSFSGSATRGGRRSFSGGGMRGGRSHSGGGRRGR